MLVPVIGIVQVGTQAHADRYTYLPQIGIYWLLTWVVSEWCGSLRHRRLVLGGLSMTIVAALVLSARVQTSYWRDSVLLWSHTLACTGDNLMVHGNLGDALMQAKRPREAAIQFQAVLRIEPRNAEALFNLGKALADDGRFAEAIQYYEEALSVVPGAVPTLNDLAWVLATCPVASLRNGAEAVELAEKAKRISGGRNASVLDTLAAAYAEAGRFSQAVETARAALALAGSGENKALADGLRTRLALYEAGLPYRKTP
jgi:tetratricopeptide (TPR) repeat protein